MNYIEDPEPKEWRALQSGVCRIFNEIGLVASESVTIQTPRGSVELDVYAVDTSSIDKIKYVVECKNWNSTIPKMVVHSFSAVMNEVGANVGFIVSKNAFQTGAIEYMRNTVIRGMTYAEFQEKYLNIWWEKFFIPKIGDIANSLVQYEEPLNTPRNTKVGQLSKSGQAQFWELYKKYQAFGVLMSFFTAHRYLKMTDLTDLPDFPSAKKIEELKITFGKLGEEFNFRSIYCRDLQGEIINKVLEVQGKFDEIFGRNIFA
ncbi:MAG: restriction endonuclease [Candidatus Ratteibacteria bacterium]|jgi:hypothetical protein